jgi:tetratricopeptide (TPR) repeat protein
MRASSRPQGHRSDRRRARSLPGFLAIALGICGGLFGFGVIAHAAPAGDTPWAEAAARGKGGPGRFARELDRRGDVLAKHRGKDPAAINALLGLLGELVGELPPGDLERFVARVSKDGGRHPLVRSYATYLLARLDESAGKLTSAAKRLRAEGYLVDWQIIGPFDNSNRVGESAKYEPETAPFSRDAQMFGKLAGEPLQWRPWQYESLPRGAYVGFDDVLRPGEQATGYATTWIHVDRETPAALHVGTGGPYAIWLDGAAVGSGEAYRMPDPLQDTHAIGLRAGWNRVLVKVSVLEGMWGFYMRVSTPSGAAIDGMKVRAEPPTGADAKQGAAVAAPAKVASLRNELETRAIGRPAAGLDLVELYRWVHPFDRDDRSASVRAREVDAKVKSARSALMLAILEPEPNGSRKALSAGVARAEKQRGGGPLHGQLLLELAWRERSLGLDRRHDELLEQAHLVAPDDPIIELALADRLAERGMAWSALRWNEDLVKRHPKSQTMQLSLAARLRDLGRTEAALAVYDATTKAHGGNRATLAARIDALLELGRADEAAQQARLAAAAMPGLPESHAEVARLEQARGDLEAAREALALAVAAAPQDADLHALLGRLLARMGQGPAAVASLKRSLALRPQQPDVRELLTSLDKREGKDLLSRWGVKLEEVGKTPTPAAWKGQQAGILHHRMAVKVLPNGLTERLDHRIIRILDDRGIRSQAVQVYSYDPAESMVEVRRARVRRTDGSIEEIGDERLVGLASAGYRMYYDQRQIQVIFAGLRVGDTVEVAFVRRDTAARNMFDQYFGDIVTLSGTEPRKFIEYVLEAPADKPMFFNVDVSKTKSKDGRTLTYRHALKDVAAIKPENGMPGWIEVTKFLHVSTYETWDDVGKWYWGLVEEQLLVDDAIKNAVKDVLAKLPTGASTKLKVDAIYEHVVRNTRYVGLEFGIHGYKPYRTTDVYSRRFGDCKDKASLLKVMLAQAGIDSHLVLVRTREQGNAPGSPASLALFNHAITYVPSLDLFLDGTAEWAGPDELPSGDQGATVLVIKDGKGADFRQIPMSKAAANVRDSVQRVRIDMAGKATIEQELAVRGAAAGGIRYEFQSAGERVEKLQKAFGELYPGATVGGVKAEGLDDIKKPPQLTLDVEVERWAQGQGDGRQRFRVLGRPSRLAENLAPQDERKYDLVIDVPSTETHTIRYRLPRGRKFSQIPTARAITGPFGKFDLAVDTTDEGATIRTTIELTRPRVGKKEYPAFREFLRQIDAGLEQTFTIEDAK